MARSGSYLIRDGGKWALVSRLSPTFEIPFESRKEALHYAKAIGWRVMRRPDWDRVKAISSDLTVSDIVSPLTNDERLIVRSGLKKIQRLRKLRHSLRLLGLGFLITPKIKKLTTDLKKWS